MIIYKEFCIYLEYNGTYTLSLYNDVIADQLSSIEEAKAEADNRLGMETWD